MRRLVFCPAVLLTVALLAAAPVAAQAQPVRTPAAPGYATNPPLSDSPLQQQLLRNYHSDLLQTQRDLAVQDPSGLSREQLDVTHRLNTVNRAPTPPPAATVTPATPPSAPFGTLTPAPFR